MIGVPLAMKIGALTTMSVTTYLSPRGLPNLPPPIISPKVQVGHTTWVLPAPSRANLSYGFLVLNSQGQGAEDYFHYQAGVLPDYQFPLIWILRGAAHIVCSIFRALGLPSRGLSVRSHSISSSLFVHPCRDWESVFKADLRIPL